MAMGDTETVELTEESTHEDIESAVDKIIADRAGEESPETEEKTKSSDTTDAQKLDTPKVTTERDTEDTADVSDDSEKPGKAEAAESDDSDWRKEAKAEASAFGLSDDDLAEFESREELDRALKLFDRQLDSERKKVLGEKGEKDKEGESKDEPSEKPSEKKDDGSRDGSYEIGLDPDVYDDEIVDEFTKMRDHYDDRLSALEAGLAKSDAAAEEERFDRAVDNLQFSQVFGKTNEESGDELKRREELFERVSIEQEVMSRLGRDFDYDALVQRVAKSSHPEEYDKRLLKNHTRKVSKQSDKRQGGGATRASDAPPTLGEEMRELYKELDQNSG